jgi:hypothetical protein
MNIEVITSFNQRYYDLIGHESVRTWLQYWPQHLTLTCYVENLLLPQQLRIKQIDFLHLGPHYDNFQQAPVKGRVHVFAKKAFSVIHAMANTTADRLIWIDADVITTKSIPLDLLTSILPNDVVSTHLGVRYLSTKTGIQGNWLVPETGIFALNLAHARFSEFQREYTRRYIEKDFAGLRRSYDNDVYGAAITGLELPCLDLCKNLDKPYKTPLKHTVLGEYLHHYKAKHSKDYFANDADQ